MGDISDMSLWSLIVPAQKPARYEVEQQVDRAQYVHITNAALPPNAKSGNHCLTLNTGAGEITVATLNINTHPQHNLDFILDQTVTFKNHGPGEVHLLGYMTTAFAPSMDEDEFEEDSEEDEDDDSDEAPPGVPLSLGNGMGKRGLPGSGKSGKGKPPATSSDEDEDDEDEDFDGEGEFPMGSDDEIMEYDEDGSGGSDDDSDDDDEDGGDSDDDDEEEEAAKPQPASGKRPSGPASTPQPTKKQKGADGPKVPASAPPKQQQAAAAKPTTPGAPVNPANEKEYEQAIKEFLKSKAGKTANISSIGSAVHKPPGVPKLGQWIKSKGTVFKVDASNQNVTLLG